MKPIVYHRYEVEGQRVVFAKQVTEMKVSALQQISASLPTGTYFVHENTLYVRTPTHSATEDYYGLLHLPAAGRPTYCDDEFHRRHCRFNGVVSEALEFAERVRTRAHADLLQSIAADEPRQRRLFC